MEQIEKTARVATENATAALDRAKRMVGMLAEIRVTVTDCRPAWRVRWKQHAKASD